MDVLKRNNVAVIGPREAQQMVFVHGFGCDQNMWRFVAPAFQTDYRTVLLDLVGAGHEVLELHGFDLRALVGASYEAMRARAELKSVALEQTITGEVPQNVSGDALKINQVLTNLLSNALKFTEHGAVLLAVHCEPTGAESVAVSFSVADTGIGIPSDQFSNIFGEYAQAGPDVRTRYCGTGLGLAISSHLVKLHGGELKVQSEPGCGSTFSFTLHLKRLDLLSTDK